MSEVKYIGGQKMRRLFISLLFLAIVFSVTMNNSTITAMEVMEGTLIINGIEITNGDPVLTGFMDQLTFPLRTILEALGSTVIWESSTGNVFFDIEGVVYASWDAFGLGNRDPRVMLITNVQYINDFYSVEFSPAGTSTIFRNVNGRIYLPEPSGVSLFRGLGFEVEADRENRILSLTNDLITIYSSETTATEVIEIDARDIGTLIIDDIEITGGDPVIKRYCQLLFPFRTILEALGSTVIWESSTGNYYFDFEGVVYVLRAVDLEPNYPDDNFLNIFISNVQNINCERDDELIRLMGGAGLSISINGTTYLNPSTGQRLFEALGFEVEIDREQKVLRISGN
jgi:hypothetical protein